MNEKDTLYTAAMVVRATTRDWEQIKQTILESFPNAKIVYQRFGVSRLRIIPESEDLTCEVNREFGAADARRASSAAGAPL